MTATITYTDDRTLPRAYDANGRVTASQALNDGLMPPGG